MKKNEYAEKMLTAMRDLPDGWLEQAEHISSNRTKRAKRIGVLLAATVAVLTLCIGTGIAMNKADPVSPATSGTENPGGFKVYAGSEIAEDPCAGKEHDFSIIEEVSTGRIIARCAECGIQKNLYDEVDESEYDCDESHFTYLEYDEYSNDYYGEFAETYYDDEKQQFLPYDKVDEDGKVYFGDGAPEWGYPHANYYFKGTVGGIMITGYTGNATKVKVPSSIDGKPVNIVDMVENVHNDTITSIIFSENIPWIRGATCYDWKKLETVYFSGGLTRFGDQDHAATHPENVFEEVVYLDNYSKISRKMATGFVGLNVYPFQNCTKLQKVYFPDGLVTMFYGFIGCENIDFYYIPATVRSDLRCTLDSICGNENLRYYVSPDHPRFCNEIDEGKYWNPDGTPRDDVNGYLKVTIQKVVTERRDEKDFMLYLKDYPDIPPYTGKE